MTPFELIDTHVHLDDDRFDVDRDQVVSRALESGVQKMIVPATTRERWPKLESIATACPNVFPAFGLHPLFLHQHSESDIAELEKQVVSTACIAIGECGLDRYCLQHTAHSEKNKEDAFASQQLYFEAQLNIAARYDLPVIVHARQAVEDVILSIRKCTTTRGVVHSFNGSMQQATRLIDLGYRLSFGGAATYPRATKIRSLIKKLPIESVLIETDAPDQTGHVMQGRRNEPSFLTEVLYTVAELRGDSAESIARQCHQNAVELFKLPP